MATAAPEKVALAQTILSGLITHVRTVNGAAEKSFRTVLRLPAPDSYSSPSTVEVRSLERLGAAGEEVSVLCKIVGYPRTFQRKDPDTGAPSGARVPTAEIALVFVSHA